VSEVAGELLHGWLPLSRTLAEPHLNGKLQLRTEATER